MEDDWIPTKTMEEAEWDRKRLAWELGLPGLRSWLYPLQAEPRDLGQVA